MPALLVTYGTGDGQTARVARAIESTLTARGFDVTRRSVWDVEDAAVDEFDAVLVGAPVRSRHHPPEVVAFVERNRDVLATRPSGFFQLSFASALASRWARDGAGDWVEALVDATGWEPDRVGLFGGTVAYTKYNPVQRLLFKLVASVTTGDTDTTRDYEYTDWDDVDRFADEFGDLVEREAGWLPTASEPSAGRHLLEFLLITGGATVLAYLLSRRRANSRQGRLDEFDERPEAASTLGEPAPAGESGETS